MRVIPFVSLSDSRKQETQAELSGSSKVLLIHGSNQNSSSQSFFNDVIYFAIQLINKKLNIDLDKCHMGLYLVNLIYVTLNPL